MLQRVLYVLLFFSSFAATAEDTLLKLFRPYGGGTDQVIPQVKTTFSGECYAQSQLIVREDAWRCMVGDKIYDPCFVKSGLNRKTALCLQSPWAGEGVRIRVTEPLNNDQNKTLDMSRTYPWAVELSTGERCLAVNSGTIYDGMPVRYKCANNNFLFGYLQRCKPVWSMLEKTPEGVVTVALREAWF